MGDMALRIDDPCEFNPDAGRAAYRNEVHAPAEFIIGANGQWRLCASCAALPHFKRFRTRRPVVIPAEDPPAADGADTVYLIALGRRAVALASWRWMPGMLSSDGRRVSSVDPYPCGIHDGDGRVRPDNWPAEHDAVPNFSDAATFGCLLALARDLLGDPTLHVRRSDMLIRGHVACVLETQTDKAVISIVVGSEQTEAGALIDAIERRERDAESALLGEMLAYRRAAGGWAEMERLVVDRDLSADTLSDTRGEAELMGDEDAMRICDLLAQVGEAGRLSAFEHAIEVAESECAREEQGDE